MKISSYSLLLFIMLISCNELFAQYSNLKFMPEKPIAGQQLKIEYNGMDTDLKDKSEINCVAYLYVDYAWRVTDLPLKRNGKTWTATLQTPDKCGFAAFKFFAGNTTDNNNDLGYVTMFTDADGKQTAGASAAWALIRRNENRLVNIEYINRDKLVSDTVAIYWLNLELKDHPEAKNIYSIITQYATAVYRAKLEGYTDQMQNIIDFLLKKAKEDEYNILAARDIYINTGNFIKSKEMEELALTNYPKGHISRLRAFQKAMANEDVKLLETAVTQFVNEYPQKPEDRFFNVNTHLNYDDLYQKLAVYAFVGDKNDGPLRKNLNKFSYYGLLNLYHKAIEIPNGGNKLLTPQQLYPYSKLIVERMEQIKDQIPELSMYKSHEEWSLLYIQNQARYVIPFHVNILRNTGHFDEALRYAASAESYLNYSNAELNDDYALILQEKKMTQKLREVLKESMIRNQAGPAILGILKADYLKNHQNETGFDAYLNTLKSGTQLELANEQLKAKLINMSMPAWQMYDAKGKLVKSDDLKGKIIIMDLWASWCAPCKEGFPAMKAIVDKYSKNPDVIFLFVDTQESGNKYKESAISYMKENNYDFNVVFDNKIEGDKLTGELYHKISRMGRTGGLPFKAVIDKKGMLRYASEENSYSPMELMDMIDNMVNMFKAD